LVPVSKTVYYYSEQGQTILSVETREKVTVYPNPVSHNLTLTFSGSQEPAFFRLFDSQGREILSQRVAEGERMNLRFLDKGVYLYSVVLDQEIHTGKLIKE